MKRTGPKRSRIQRELDRQTVVQLTLKGWTQVQIAQHLELHHSSVSRDLAVIRKEWKESAVRDFDLDRREELERLAMVEQELWAGWERSQEAKEISTNDKFLTGKTAEGTPIGKVKIGTRTEQKVGDVSFLTGVLKVVDSRCKLLGLYPSERDSTAEVQLNANQISVISTLMKEANVNSN